MVDSVGQSNALDVERKDVSFLDNQGSSHIVRRELRGSNALITFIVVFDKLQSVVLLSVSEDFNDSEFLLTQTSLLVHSMESHSKVVLIEQNCNIVNFAKDNILFVELLDYFTSDSVDEVDHNFRAIAVFLLGLGSQSKHVLVEVLVDDVVLRECSRDKMIMLNLRFSGVLTLDL